MAVAGHQVGKALCDALGLPKYTRGFTLRCYFDDAVTVECEYYPDLTLDAAGNLTLEMARWELAAIRNPTDAPKSIKFDAWMRDRRDAAHAAYMARHAAGGRAYL